MSQKENKSGILPLEFKVLIEPETIEEKTAGGIILPQKTKEMEQMAQVRGILIDIGSNAFEDWGLIPDAGDRVYFGKYAGYIVKGNDGKEYRLCNDKDICAIIEEEKLRQGMD